MDVVGMIKRAPGSKNYTVTRASADGSYDQSTVGSEGTFIAGATTTVQIWGSVQPAQPEDLISIPEGDRESERMRFYSFPILLNNDTARLRKGDEVPFNGFTWRVESIAHWPNHSLAIIVRENTDVN